MRISVPLTLVLSALAACSGGNDRAREQGHTLAPETVAAMQAQIEREGEAAADELVGLVLASPVALPGGELDRLGALLIERSDRERLLAHLHARSLAHPDARNLADWLARLEDDERAVMRGVDVVGY